MTQKDDDLRALGKDLIRAQRRVVAANNAAKMANVEVRDAQADLITLQGLHEAADDAVDTERDEPTTTRVNSPARPRE